MTADVDVTVDPGQTGTLALVEALSRAGFALRIDLGEDFLREARLPLVHRAQPCPSTWCSQGLAFMASFSRVEGSSILAACAYH